MSSTLLPAYAHGLWIGQSFLSSNTNECSIYQEFMWSLCLTPSRTFPSAFGACVYDTPSVGVIRGSWTPAAASSAHVGPLTETINNVTRTYNGTLSKAEDGALVIKGGWDEVGTGKSGFFVVRKEEEGTNTTDRRHVSGLWLGQAVPDPSLEEFFIATNPIRWALSIIYPEANSQRLLFFLLIWYLTK